MRVAPSTFAALMLLTAACGSSGGGTSSGTTTGKPATTGGTTGGPLLAAGASCSSNSACASGVCGTEGIGSCCSHACAETDSTCAASGCDGTGACVYPDAAAVCGSSCSGATLSSKACDGSGNCKPQPGGHACPNNFDCALDGGCNTSCTSIADCVTGFTCNAGACVAQVATGTCTENDDCTSGVCGAHGSGHCCAVQCDTSDATCGATDCDGASGVCIYPEPAIGCGTTAPSCSGSTETKSQRCNGLGACSPAQQVSCGAFACGATQCLSTCSDDTNCGENDSCDVTTLTCCAGLTDGGKLAVDSLLGEDKEACCGLGSQPPCGTLHHALAMIAGAGVQNVTVVATVDGAGGDWAPPAGETYPIMLSAGVELSAPGVFFNDLSGKNEILDVQSGTPASASVAGTAAAAVRIGMDSQGTQTLDLSSIQVENGATLYIADAVVNGNASNQSNAITVAGGGALIIGQDSSAATLGGIVIGNEADDPLQDGYNGIFCLTAPGLGCSVSDVSLKGSNLVIEDQEGYDIWADDGAVISLTSAPTIGVKPPSSGFHTCSSKVEAETGGQAAIVLNGSAQLTFDNGFISCVAGDGVDLQESPEDGLPTLEMDGTTIQGTQFGIHAFAGKATVTSSTIWYNYNGVWQDTDGTNVGTVDLGGGAAGGTNTVVCSNGAEDAFGKGGTGQAPGVSVLNTTADLLVATGVDWDTPGPDLFACDATLTGCTCERSSCLVDAGGEGMDAVYEGAGTIDTSDGGASSADCEVNPPKTGCGPGNPCPPGQTCCGGSPSTCAQLCP